MLFQLLLAVRIVHGLDDTTQITCTNSVVKVEETLAGGCQATLRDGGSAVDGLFSDLGLVVDSGTIGNVDPPSGTATAFTFDVTMEATSGEFAMTNNVNVSSLTITVFDEPDSTSTFLCPSVVAVDTPFNCSSIPKNNGQRIWAFDRFVVTGISGTDAIEWTQMTQAGVANAFVIEGVTSVSATYTMSNGLTPTSLLEVTDAADSTSSIECAAATFAVNDEIECTIFARKEGVPVTVPRSSFTITGVTDLTAYRDFRPALGKQFYFFLTVLGFDQTGPWILQDGVSAIGFPLTVVTAPDSTSQLTCDEEVAVGGKARCTISPRLKSKPIWAARSAWVVGAVDEGGDSVGSFSALAPASEGAAEFTFAFTTTANMMADDQIFVNDGLSQTSTLRLVATTTADDTSTLTCETSVADVGQAVLCSIHARASDTTVYTTANTFTVTDGMQEGLFSGYNNTAGAYFGFTYTPSKQGTVNARVYSSSSSSSSSLSSSSSSSSSSSASACSLCLSARSFSSLSGSHRRRRKRVVTLSPVPAVAKALTTTTTTEPQPQASTTTGSATGPSAATTAMADSARSMRSGALAPSVTVKQSMPLFELDLAVLKRLPSLADWDLILDARSPAEFAVSHLPGSTNTPVLDDAQHKEIGTKFKDSPFEASRAGAALISARIGTFLTSPPLCHLPKHSRVLVYCARGGQRSASIATVLSRVGWHVAVVKDGYKAVRRQVQAELQHLEHFQWHTIRGPTGVGKTRLLHELRKQGGQVVDLEGLAQHRGSVLGCGHSPQPSQKAFEQALVHVVIACRMDPARPIFIEAESSRIGKLQVPKVLHDCIRNSPLSTRIAMPLPSRIALLREEYRYTEQDPEALLRTLESLKRFVGKARLADWRTFIHAAQWDKLVESLLVDYYDRAYQGLAHHTAKEATDPQTVRSGELCEQELLIKDGTLESMSAAAAQLLEKWDEQKPSSPQCS